MISTYDENTGTKITDKAKAFGASLAGVANADAVRHSPSYKIYGDDERLLKSRTVLVLASIRGLYAIFR